MRNGCQWGRVYDFCPHTCFWRHSCVAQAGLNSIYNETNLEFLICWHLHPKYSDYRHTPQLVYVVQWIRSRASCMIHRTKPPPQVLSIHLMECQLEQTQFCLGNEGVILIRFSLCTLSLHTFIRHCDGPVRGNKLLHFNWTLCVPDWPHSLKGSVGIKNTEPLFQKLLWVYIGGEKAFWSPVPWAVRSLHEGGATRLGSLDRQV